jgi:YD repeat-containing protein
MNPHNPSRRRLLGGIAARLFAWLWSGKVNSQEPAPQVAPYWIADTLGGGTITCEAYDLNGDFITSTVPKGCVVCTTFEYDSQKRVIRITDHC